MSVILEFTIPSDQFLLGRVLSKAESMEVELERIVPTGNTVMPFLWVTGRDFETFETEVTDHSAVEDLIALDRVGDSTLYRISWHVEENELIRGITVAEGTILEARGDGGWSFRVRFPDHDGLSKFYNYCTERGIGIHIERTYTLTERTDSVHQFGLSQEQREALVLGLRRGYFDTPSAVDLDELAAELDISQQAMSNRIRRGTKQVLSKALLSAAADFD